ncbi:MAG: protein kinase, partial [Planctomycetota bacterium]
MTMSLQHWPRARRILEDALERPTEVRRAFVAAACAGDRALRAEVESLLDHDEPSSTFLAPPDRGAAKRVAALAGAHEAVGGRVGPWRLTGVLAAGGMGVVYAAERADAQYDKVVAVKVLHAGAPTARTAARFRRERRILARLEHPNIARLIDGGTTADGRPYIVME